MTDRTELFEAALDSIPEGIALLGAEGWVMFWNRAAEAITGYASVDLLARPIPEALEALLLDGAEHGSIQPARGALVHARHKLGHSVQAIARNRVLRDGMGGRIGTAVVFHPAEGLDALPHGDGGESAGVAASQTELEDQLGAEFEDFARGGLPFGVLWVAVDQARDLHKTHGAMACEAMLGKVERALAHGLRPGEEMGRWGDGEFLVVSHERTPELLAAHAQVLAGLARTADFRWWGDRVSLTVSIGAAQADRDETLAQLLERAQEGMVSSIHAGGNHITLAPRGQACLPS
ncbi:MAG: diguanylate cyclase [Terracidiphilus sp.]|jgi:diguanylate cyclase (GGDEF)-like protein/PAS domain S-box-containing protein